MKKYILMLACLSLTACMSGSGGNNTPTTNTQPSSNPLSQSAYEIWLSQGHTGTEQEFLDWLVSEGADDPVVFNRAINWDVAGAYVMRVTNSNNAGEFIQSNWNSTAVETDQPWPTHNGYKQYYLAAQNNAQDSHETVIYNEKELDLGNYGVWTTRNTSNYYYPSVGVMGYIHNRENAEIYTPSTNTIFTGGTLAYLVSSEVNNFNPTLIKGNALFAYNPTTAVLDLDFDNYYKITFIANTNEQSQVVVSGTNSTGVSGFDAQTGTFTTNSKGFEVGFLRDGTTEEALGTYGVPFCNNGQAYCQQLPKSVNVSQFGISGAFGGTKQ